MTGRVRNSGVIAAVLLVFGVAAADSLRDAVPSGGAEEARRTTTEGERVTPQRFLPVRGARGSLVFTDPDGCHVREFAVGSATEYPLVRTRGNCRLWVPWFGARVAFGVANAANAGVAFEFADLNHPEEEFRTEYTHDGRIAWSFDGQRTTWCEGPDEGIDFEFYAERRLLDGCAAGYTPGGALVFVEGRRVLVGSTLASARLLLAARAPVDEVAVGVDGSVGAVVRARLERYAEGRRTHSRPVPDVAITAPPSFSPNNCGVLIYARGEVRLVDLGCLGTGDRKWRAKDGDWSPDGKWIVVAISDGIAFHRVDGAPLEAVWPQNAAELGWRGHVGG